MKWAAALAGVALVLASPAQAQVDPEQSFWMQEAQAALADGDSDRARTALERVLAVDPGNPAAQDLLRRIEPAGSAPMDEVATALVSGMLDDQGVISPEEALSRLRADPYDPEAPRLKKVLGDDYFQQAQAAEKDGKKGMAMVAFRRAIFFQPREPLMRYEMFQALMRRDRLVEALEQAEIFLELQNEGALAREMERQLVEVHTRLGSKKMQANRWTAAIEHFRKVLGVQGGPKGFGEVEEKLAVCFYTLGVREKASGRTREACLQFSQLLELRPPQGLPRETFDRAYLEKLRSNALSPLWNQGKASKEEGRPLEAYRFLGHVLSLGTQEWMLKLSRKYRKEIEDIAGESIALEEARLRRGMAPSKEAAVPAPALAPAPGIAPGLVPGGGPVAPAPMPTALPPGTVPAPVRPVVPVVPGEVPAPAPAGAPLAARPPAPSGPMILPPRPAPATIPARAPQDLEGELAEPGLNSASLDELLYGGSP
jgi:tetratricopeptide (TPR) repeat protein